MFELNFTQKRKREFFSTSFAVILSAVALPIVLKTEFNFKLILHITILFSKVEAAALNPRSVFKTHLKTHPIVLFSPRLKEGKIIHQKGLRVPFTLIFHSKAT